MPLSSTLSQEIAPDDRIIGALRLVLAVASLLFVQFTPDALTLRPHLLDALLSAYVALSAGALGLTFHRRRLSPAIVEALPWIDVSCYTLLIAGSGGQDSVFFGLYLFAILTAAFCGGFAGGLRITLAAVAGFSFVALLSVSYEPQTLLQLHKILWRPVFLLVMGIMIARWGDREITLKRRLALLKEVGRASNPRFGVAHTIGSIMQRLIDFYGAERCWLISRDPLSGQYFWQRTERALPGAEARVEPLPEAATAALLAAPRDWALSCEGHRRGQAKLRACDTTSGAEMAVDAPLEAIGQKLRVALQADSFVTVPLHCRGEADGRLFVAARGRGFDLSDAEYLRQVIEYVMPAVETIRLIDQLATNAARHERSRLSHGIHDGLIQPYIGLQMGLEALRRKALAGRSQVEDIERLIALSSEGVGALRRTMLELENEARTDDGLVSALRYGAARFEEESGIRVRVEADDDLRVSDRLAAEIFHMMAEGLSNIRRHTWAGWASIGLRCRDHRLELRLENENVAARGQGENELTAFVPRSITARAASLGGCARVERTARSTLVRVEIPL
jgi:signal transduction histidine kinase